MTLKFSTAGESHGKALVALVEGLPAGLPISADWVDRDLVRRMQGYGRGARMKIERDHIEWLSGVRAGETLGSARRHADPQPRLGQLGGRDGRTRPPTPGELRRRRVTRPRPGHADLAGVLKYDRVDARDILERASARETTARVAAGALARRLLDEFGVEIGSHVVSLGGVLASPPAELPVPLNDAVRPLRGARARPRGRGRDHPPHRRRQEGRRHPGRRGRGGGARRGRRARQPRELGPEARRPAGRDADVDPRREGGRDRARRRGRAPARAPAVHDPIDPPLDGLAPGRPAPVPPLAGDRRGGFRRPTNNAGGLEGGITTGEPLVLRVAMKPISTLMSPLATVDLATGRTANAQSERSDVTAVPAMGVIAEALIALVLADAMLEKFGGDSLAEMRRNFDGYVASLGARWSALREPAEG